MEHLQLNLHTTRMEVLQAHQHNQRLHTEVTQHQLNNKVTMLAVNKVTVNRATGSRVTVVHPNNLQHQLLLRVILKVILNNKLHHHTMVEDLMVDISDEAVNCSSQMISVDHV